MDALAIDLRNHFSQAELQQMQNWTITTGLKVQSEKVQDWITMRNEEYNERPDLINRVAEATGVDLETWMPPADIPSKED